jgi:glutathione-regulated potassium-efflux system protein KefB
MPYLVDALIFLAAVAVAAPIATRLGLGSVLGYLAAGVAIGPHALGLFAGGPDDAAKVMHAAELGVVLLLFLVGLELQPQRLLELRRPVFGLGVAQVLASSALLALAARALGLAWPAAVVTGLGLSLSSTAFALQLLAERNELSTGHGQAAFGILLFQDLAVIPGRPTSRRSCRPGSPRSGRSPSSPPSSPAAASSRARRCGSSRPCGAPRS